MKLKIACRTNLRTKWPTIVGDDNRRVDSLNLKTMLSHWSVHTLHSNHHIGAQYLDSGLDSWNGNLDWILDWHVGRRRSFPTIQTIAVAPYMANQKAMLCFIETPCSGGWYWQCTFNYSHQYWLGQWAFSSSRIASDFQRLPPVLGWLVLVWTFSYSPWC